MQTVHIEKLVFGGQALARVNGKAVFVWGALPGEDVEIEYTNEKKNFVEAVVVKILNPSPDRVDPREISYLSTSPWQILSWTAENKWKQQIAIETYGRHGGLILQDNKPEIFFDEREYEYRNKIEFYFDKLPNGKIYLAFLRRGQIKRIPVNGSVLAKPVLNKYAQYILAHINKLEIDSRTLDKLILKTNEKNQVIAGLLVNGNIKNIEIPLSNDLLGFGIYNAENNKPIFEDGQLFLEDKILGLKLKYGLFSFFQVNIPVFEQVLKDIAVFAGPKNELTDFYAGVGAISLPISQNRNKTELIESNYEAAEFAKENIVLNNLLNCEVICAPSETMLEKISSNRIIVVDPPRNGLDIKLVNRLLTKRPARIIYLSCDLSTQARDINYLGQAYKVSYIKLYNFFPRTPHIEGLCVLDC
ncbi:MAG: TRAM domain-containing protein [bacterium]|nr:TRAM domain-containing protein [bacterium]